MLGERLRYCKDEAARPKSRQGRRQGVRRASDRAAASACDRERTVAVCDGFECRIEARQRGSASATMRRSWMISVPTENAAISCERCSGCA